MLVDEQDNSPVSGADPVEQAADSPSGSGLAAERERRLSRVAEIRSAGSEPYPYRFDRSHSVSEVRDRWGHLEAGSETDDRVTVAGRVMLLRDSGKLIFATLRDRSGDIQLFVSRAVIGDDGFAEVKELDLGDWVGVEGTVMTTRKGELSVKVDACSLLSKAVRPLPEIESAVCSAESPSAGVLSCSSTSTPRYRPATTGHGS